MSPEPLSGRQGIVSCRLSPLPGAEVTEMPQLPISFPDIQGTSEAELRSLSSVSGPPSKLNSVIAGEDVFLITCQVFPTDRHRDLFLQEGKNVTPCCL